MATPIQTLTTTILDPHYSIHRETLAPTQRSPIGGGGVILRRFYERPLYQFRLHASHENAAFSQAFYAFAHYHQGDTPFWYGGDKWSAPHNATPATVGYGTGAQTHYYLPNRNILTGPTVKVDGVTTAVTLTASSGLIVFGAAPADGTLITAEAYTCKYKCVFWNDGDVLLSEEYFANQLSRFEGILLRELFP
jgi:hypothetical protein